MNIRTFTAKDAATALQLVKRELGPHAVVLHTRSYKQGGVLGIGAKPVVEVTAADGREVGRSKRREARTSPRAQALRAARPNTPATEPTADPPMAGDLIRRTYQAARAQFDTSTALEGVVDQALQASSPPVVATPPPPVGNLEQAQLAKELAAVKLLVQQVAQHQHRTELTEVSPGMPDPLVEHYAELIQQEVASELAKELVGNVRNNPDTQPHGCPDTLRSALLDELAQMLPTDPEAGQLKPTDDGRPRVIALVGPTGVGKTTTVAKLAATFKLKQNKRVGLITADTYRIAAVDQLRTYAGIIGLPLEVVSGPSELKRAMERLADCDVIILDTAGRSQRDAHRLGELAELIDAAQPHETHLVLSSIASERVLLEVIERFSQIDTNRLIFTKLDEAAACGVLVNVARRVGKPLSYFTTGQEVPHHIEPGCGRKLAERVLGMEAAQ